MPRIPGKISFSIATFCQMIHFFGLRFGVFGAVHTNFFRNFRVLEKYFRLIGIELPDSRRAIRFGHIAAAATSEIRSLLQWAGRDDNNFGLTGRVLTNPTISPLRCKHLSPHAVRNPHWSVPFRAIMILIVGKVSGLQICRVLGIATRKAI